MVAHTILYRRYMASRRRAPQQLSWYASIWFLSLSYPEDALRISSDLRARVSYINLPPGESVYYTYILTPLKKGTYHVRISASGKYVEQPLRAEIAEGSKEVEVKVYSPEDNPKNSVELV
jgi:hypothetical protein